MDETDQYIDNLHVERVNAALLARGLPPHLRRALSTRNLLPRIGDAAAMSGGLGARGAAAGMQWGGSVAVAGKVLQLACACLLACGVCATHRARCFCLPAGNHWIASHRPAPPHPAPAHTVRVNGSWETLRPHPQRPPQRPAPQRRR